MRKGLRRAARILMAAGALALARPAAAQPPAEAPAAVEEATLPAEQARREELRVSLAWLADPATFPHALTARVRGDSLEAAGAVPDLEVKAVALKLARQHTSLPVLDALEVRPGKAENRVALPAGAVQRAAAGLLSMAVGARGRDMTVRARADGQVTVRGTVGSLEEKLYVSQRLRQVAGCTSVVNCLTVAAPAAGRPPAVRGPAGSLEEKQFVSDQLRQAGGRPAPRPPAEEAAAAPPPPAVSVMSVTPGPAVPLSRLAPSLSAQEADLHLPGKGQSAASGGRSPLLADKQGAPAPRSPALSRRRRPLRRRRPPLPPVPRRPAVAPATAKPASYVAPAPQASPSPAVVPARLRQRVLAACGDQALTVQVLTAPDQSVRVQVRVASYAAQVQLAPRILQLPEMKAPNVHLEIQVAH